MKSACEFKQEQEQEEEEGQEQEQEQEQEKEQEQEQEQEQGQEQEMSEENTPRRRQSEGIEFRQGRLVRRKLEAQVRFRVIGVQV